MKPSKQKTTILFVNKSSRAIKPLQVSNSLVIHWKKYVVAILLVFISLIGIIAYLASCNISQEKMQETLASKIHSMHQIISQMDTGAIKNKFSNIDKELSSINKFLKARGITYALNGMQGGETDNDIISVSEISGFYEGYLNRILYNLAYTPLGLPFSGAITSSFGHRENPFGGGDVETHKGLDISGPMGAEVKAMAKGEVIFAGLKGGFGNCIILKHANGFETLYGHLSKVLVEPGDKIDIGQTIGRIGSTGRSTGPHLHYEVHRFGEKIDPRNFLTLE